MTPQILQQIGILLECFIPCFKQRRTFRYLKEFFKGIIMTGRKTVTRIFLTTDRQRHFTNYYRFLKTYKWKFYDVAMKLLILIQNSFELLVDGDGVYAKNLFIALDTTFAKKSGKKFDGADIFHDHSSGKNKAKYVWGHCIFVLGVLYRIPTLGPLCLPFLASIYFREATIKRQKLDEKFVKMLEKAVDMVVSVKGCCKKPITVVADAFFSKKPFFKPLFEKGIFVLSRMRHDAVAYRPALPKKEKTRGRKRKYGEKVKLKKLLDTEPLCAMNIKSGKKTKEIKYVMKDFLLRGYPGFVRFLVIKDKKTVILMTTNLTLCAKDMLEVYRSRFQIEFSFRDLKQHLGFEDYQVRRKTAICRFLNITLLVYSLLRIVLVTNQSVRKTVENYLDQPWRCSLPIFSMEQLISVLRNEFMLQRFFDVSGLCPKTKKIPGSQKFTAGKTPIKG